MKTPLTDAIDQHWPPKVFHQETFFNKAPGTEPTSDTPRCILGEEIVLKKIGNKGLSNFILEANIWLLDNEDPNISIINDNEGREAVLEALRKYEHTLN